MKIIIILLLCFTLLGCSNDKFSYEKINSKQALEIMQNNDYLLVDVRSREEFAANHLDNAFNIPEEEITSLIKINKDTVLFVYCETGKRSKRAAQKLLDLGYQVYDLGALKDINLDE